MITDIILVVTIVILEVMHQIERRNLYLLIKSNDVTDYKALTDKPHFTKRVSRVEAVRRANRGE